MEERRLRLISRSVTCRSTATTVLALSFLVFLSIQVVSVAGITLLELETAIDALRSKGYDLFGNAIKTSDLRFDLLYGGDSFTIFAPDDSSLFAFDLASQASEYIQTLRFHVSPHRLTISDLRNLSMSLFPYLDTMLIGHSLFITTNHKIESNDTIIVEGIQISFENLYVSSTLVIHGLKGNLDVKFQEWGNPSNLPPAISPTPSDGSGPVLSPTKQDLITPASSPAQN